MQNYDFPLQRVPNSKKKEAEWYAACADWIIAQGQANKDTNELEVRYSILQGNEQLFASKYKLYLPTEEELRAEIENQKTIFNLQHEKDNNEDNK